MPYQRRHRRKRGAFQRRPVGTDYLGTASKALAVAYSVKKLLNIEYKSELTGLTNDMSTTATITNLTAIAQGDDFDDRNGNKIRLASISWKGNVLKSSVPETQMGRVMIIRDNNGSTTQPIITDLFSDESSFFNGRHKLDDPQTNSRFTVLLDRQFALDDSKAQLSTVSWYKKLDHHCFFSGSAATDEGKGALYMIQGSDQATNVMLNRTDVVIKFIDN